MNDNTLLLLVARFVFATGPHDWDAGSMQKMKEWFYEQVPQENVEKFKWSLVEECFPFILEQVKDVLKNTDHSSIPWHSPDNIVWPALLEISTRFPQSK